MTNESEFDKFAGDYRQIHAANITRSGESPEYFAEYKVRDTAGLVRASALPASLRILDFGSGIGTSVPYFRTHLPDARLTCLDVSEKSLARGREQFPGLAEFRHFDGGELPFEDEQLHVVFAACVFHHIEARHHAHFLREFLRILRPGGLLVIFEHNPLNPLTVHAVKTCEFDEDAVLIRAGTLKRTVAEAGFRNIRRHYRIFFPHALRGLRFLERFMTALPLGAQYYVAANKPG